MELARLLANVPLAIDPGVLPMLCEQARVREAAGQAALPRRRAPGASASPAGVSVVGLYGVLSPRASFLSWLFGGTTMEDFTAELRTAAADPSTSVILIDIDSPGGEVSLVPETGDEIRRAGAQKPIIAIARTMAASAAYWLASQADELLVTASGEVGSVGVVAMHVDESGLNAKIGIAPTYIFAGRFKTEANPDMPLDDGARAYIQSQIDQTYADFVSAVARGRNTTEKRVRETFGEGRMVDAKEAVRRGMADGVATLDTALGRVPNVLSAHRRRLAAIEQDQAWFDDLIRRRGGRPGR